MLKIVALIATLAAGLISTHVSAAFVHTSWKTEGDRLATLDTDTGLEWLSLRQTRGQSVNDILSRTNGGDLTGWRLATYSEVKKLWETALKKTLPDVYKGITYAGHPLRYWLLNSSDYNTLGYALLDNGAVRMFGTNNNHGGTYVHIGGNFNVNTKSATAGIYLVSDGGTTLSSVNDPSLNINNPNAPINTADVPVPAGMAAAGVLMLILGARRRVA